MSAVWAEHVGVDVDLGSVAFSVLVGSGGGGMLTRGE